jgi:hypothetical protein
MILGISESPLHDRLFHLIKKEQSTCMNNIGKIARDVGRPAPPAGCMTQRPFVVIIVVVAAAPLVRAAAGSWNST